MAPHAENINGAVDGWHGTPSAPVADSLFVVDSPDVVYTESAIETKYTYRTTSVTKSPTGQYVAAPKETTYDLKVQKKVGKVGMMLVGWGGNNGSTVTAGIMANRRGLSWDTRDGKQAANYYGSVVMASTIKLGLDTATGAEINVPLHQMLPMAHPNGLVVGGWDISGANLAEAMDRAKVLEPGLKKQIRDDMAAMKPLPSIYYPDFIAANQEDRADNVLDGKTASMTHVETIRQNIR